MGNGYLTVQVRTGENALPISNANIVIKDYNENPLFFQETNMNGNTDKVLLPAPNMSHTLDPYYGKPAYSEWNVDISADGYVTEHIHGVQVLDTQTTILPVNMKPILDEQNPITESDINIPPIGLLIPAEDRKVAPFAGRSLKEVIIPEYITVHLGVPTNASARNVRVKFVDYIKNVTSSEIYSTWPESSLIANIHAITTFAINRVYTEWYRSRGFNFDITNSTSYDQYYRDGGVVFENISKLVDNIFNIYARRYGFKNPFFTQFCNGTTAVCDGLSQWGTVTLANRGMTPLQILHYYYPNDLELIQSQNIMGITESYPGTPLRLGSQGEDVRRIQNQLNRIRVNFPLIQQISNPNGNFGADTETAVRTFQRTFNLTADGIVGRATWNKISFIFVGVTRLAELNSEGQRVSIGKNPPNTVLSQGSKGGDVLELQFIINYISPYFPTIPFVIQDGIFGPSTKNAVIEFQKTFGLTPDGVVGPATWNKLYAAFRGVDENVTPPTSILPPEEPSNVSPPFPGTILANGSTGPDVRLMQTYLNTIRIVYTDIPYLIVDGIFGERTKEAVTAFQRRFLLTPDGIIGPLTWDYIIKQFLLVTGNSSISLEYPGEPLELGSQGSAVRLIQMFLSELRSPYPSLPEITIDGIFGPNTRAAVIGFQTLFGLPVTGIIDSDTWYAIIKERSSRF